MPVINELKRVRTPNESRLFIWLACPDCGKERWVQQGRAKRQGFQCVCNSCAHKRHRGCETHLRFDKHPNWKGGRKLKNGYVEICLRPDDFFAPMRTKEGYVLEHRLTMAKHLGRNLQRWELVHHRGIKYPKGSIENKQDNRIENLQLITDERHNQITILENRIAHLESQIAKLKNNHP